MEMLKSFTNVSKGFSPEWWVCAFLLTTL
jgi:hypothetical protein